MSYLTVLIVLSGNRTQKSYKAMAMFKNKANKPTYLIQAPIVTKIPDPASQQSHGRLNTFFCRLLRKHKMPNIEKQINMLSMSMNLD